MKAKAYPQGKKFTSSVNLLALLLHFIIKFVEMDWKDEEDLNFNEFDDGRTSSGREELVDQNRNQYGLHFVLGLVLVLCGVLENVFVCWILIRKKRKCFKSFSNFHLLNLAISDILFRAVSVPELLPGEIIGGSDFICKLIDFSRHTTLAVTFAILAGISFDRYIHIVHPFRARTITWKHSRNVIVLSWVCGGLLSAPFLSSTVWTVEVNEETMDKFGNCVDKHGLSFQISLAVFLFGAFIVPLVFMGFVYSRIVIVLWRRDRSKISNKNMIKTKLRVVKMMVLIVLTYFITWGPYLIFRTVTVFSLEGRNSEEVEGEGSTELQSDNEELYESLQLFEGISDTLSLMSSILNPLIFSFYNASFKEEVYNIFRRMKGAKCFGKRKHIVVPLAEQTRDTTT